LGEERGRINYDLIFLILLLLAFIPRVFGINDVPISHDEQLVADRYMGRPVLETLLTYYVGSHILPTFLSRVAVEILGQNHFALRWPSAMMATLSLPLFYRFATDLFGKRVGLASAFLLAVSPFHILFAHEMRGHSSSMFFPLLTFYFLYKIFATGKRQYWAWFTLAAILSVYCHHFTVFMLAGEAVIIAFWLAGRFRASGQSWRAFLPQRALWPLASLLVCGLVLGVLFAPSLAQSSAGQGGTDEFLIGVQPVGGRPKVEISLLSTYTEFSGAVASKTVHNPPLGTRPLAFFAFLGLALLGSISGLAGGERGQAAFLLGLNLLPFAFLELGKMIIRVFWSYPPLDFLVAAYIALVIVAGAILWAVQAGFGKGWRSWAALVLPVGLLIFYAAMSDRLTGWLWSRPHYLSFILLPYLLLAARGVVALGEKVGQLLRRKWAAKASLASSLSVVLLLAALAWPNLALAQETLAGQVRGNWAAVARYLGPRVAPYDVVLCQPFDHDWRPRDIIDECARDLTYRLKWYAPLLYPVRGANGVDFQEISAQGPAVGQAGRVWVVLWGADDASRLAPAGNALQVTFDRYDVTGLLLAAEGQTILDNLIQTFRVLLDIGPTDGERFDYYLRLAELEAARGHREQAQAALAAALAIQPDDAEAEARVALTGKALERTPVLPDAAQAVGAILGERIELTGYSLERAEAAPGDTVGLTLSWQALAPLSADYTVFIHLRDAANRTVAQQDFQPFDGVHPTGQWLVGQKIVETRRLTLPADLPAGTYEFRVGMYDPRSMERLPVSSDTSGENVVVLCSLRVR
jgi:uncharacterized membrane protein